MKVCPKCSETSIHPVIYNPLLIAFGDPKTVGALAEHNTAKLGTYEREAMWAAQDERKEFIKKSVREEFQKKIPAGASLPEEKPKEKPWFGEPTKDLTTLTPKETQRYIFEGK